MPIFIPALIGAALLGVSAGATVKASRSRKLAAKLHEQTDHEFQVARRDAQWQQQETNKKLTLLLTQKLRARDQTVARLVNLMVALNQTARLKAFTDLSEIAGEGAALTFAPPTVGLPTVAIGLATSLASGVGVSVAAYGAVGALGTASTGTAISTLSGAAATKATLAWLGGGAISAAGGGVVVGTAVVGGLVVAPALLVGSLLLANSAGNALHATRQGQAKARQEIANLTGETSALWHLARRSDELSVVVQCLTERLERQLDLIGDPAAFDPQDDNSIKRLGAAAALGEVLGEAVRTPVMDAKGEAPASFERLIRKYRTWS